MPLTTRLFGWFCRDGVVPLLFLALTAPSHAQIIPDNTLPQNSQVVPGCTNCIINGGTAREFNLFHSFREFSISTGGSARFNNAPNIQNILVRVTGDRVSAVNGTLQAQHSANLFLLNPNGIVFGPNARLQVGGSFLATTASSFKFADGSDFSAVNPTPALLTVSAPIGLQFGNNPAPILHQPPVIPATGLPSFRGQPQKTLAFVGGDINIAGGSLLTLNGQIELGAVGDMSFVGLSPSQTGFTLNYGATSTFRDIQLSNNALVVAAGSGGGVNLTSRNLRFQNGSQLISLATGVNRGADITVNLTETLEASGTATSLATSGGINRSGIFTATSTFGGAGNITVSAQRINLLGGGQISSVTTGSGNAGNLSINATESITAIGTSSQNSSIFSGILTQALASATGNAGTLTINTNALTLQNGAQITSTTFGRGSAGTLRVKAETIDLSGVILTPEGKMFFDQRNVPLVSGLFASADQGSTGNAATLIVETKQLRMRDGAGIQTSTLGSGDAGDLFINADSIELTGTAPDLISPTSILAASGGIPRSRVGIAEATGKGGTINLTTNSLTVQNGAEIAVSSLNPNGNSRGAGNLQIQARTITLSDRGKLNAETASGNGGNINLQVQEVLLLRRNSSISATAGTNQVGGDGGNITIRSPFIIAVLSENSDITANAFTGRGGRVDITAQGIYGIQFRDRPTPESDITASSEFGLSGIVTLTVPNLDPSRGLITLPLDLADPTNQIAQGCAPARAGSSFSAVGRGGLPLSPDMEWSYNKLQQWVTLDAQELAHRPSQSENSNTQSTSALVASASTTSPQSEIVEAQEWHQDGNNNIWLVANSPFSVSAFSSFQCQ